MSPTPKATFVREAARCGHFWQTIARARSSAKAVSFASRLSGTAFGGAAETPALGKSSAIGVGVRADEEVVTGTGTADSGVNADCSRLAPATGAVGIGDRAVSTRHDSGETKMNLAPSDLSRLR